MMITRVLDVMFRLCLGLFLVGGAVVVAVQATGLVLGRGAVVQDVVSWAGVPTFALAAAAGLLGFLLSYLKGWDTTD